MGYSALIRIRNPTRHLAHCLALGLSLEPEGYCVEIQASTPAHAWAELWRLVQALEAGGVEVVEARLLWAIGPERSSWAMDERIPQP